MLNKELEEQKIQFTLKKIPVLEQSSTYSGSSVDIISVSDVNELANTFGHLSIQLNKGQAIFLPPSPSSYDSLNNRTVETTLQESDVIDYN